MFERHGIKEKLRCLAGALLALLWFYAAISKLIEFSDYTKAMHKQPLNNSLQELLIYALPPAELLIGAALLTTRFYYEGLFASAILLLLFTVYILCVKIKVFGHIPCSCGGLIGHMGWTFHLWFNFFFFALNLSTIVIYRRKECCDIE